MINAIANEFNLDIYIYSLAGQDSTSLISTLSKIPGHSIVLFEDIDVAFPNPKREKEKEKKTGSKFCMKSFLNAIDGIKSNNNGIIFIFTTNHPENLDPALIRAGRMDLKIKLGYLEKEEISGMISRFFPAESDYSHNIIDYLKEKEIIPAELSEFLIANRKKELKEVWQLIKEKEWGDEMYSNDLEKEPPVSTNLVSIDNFVRPINFKQQ